MERKLGIKIDEQLIRCFGPVAVVGCISFGEVRCFLGFLGHMC